MNEPQRSESENRIRSLREQILTLSDEQNESLRSATFVGMSAEEGKEFDTRQGRLIELIKRLAEIDQR